MSEVPLYGSDSHVRLTARSVYFRVLIWVFGFSGFRVWGFRVLGFWGFGGLDFWGYGVHVWGFGVRTWADRILVHPRFDLDSVWGVGFGVSSFGFRVSG